MTTGRAARGVVLLVAVLFAGLLAEGALLGPATSTETRYAEMGREMAASGDWVVPTLNGAPLLEKPPFEYWANAAAFTVLGVSDAAARVPHLLAAALVLWLVGLAARRFSPEAEGLEGARHRSRLAVLALATMPGFLVQAYTVSTDIWLVLTTTAAGLALLETGRAQGRPALRWTLLLHGATGVGMLVKGPLTLGLVFGAAAVLAALRRDARHLKPFFHPLGILLFAAISVPWFVLANARIPGLLHDLVSRRLFGGLASSADFHRHSWWVVWLPLFGAFPWLATLPASVKALSRRGEWLRGPGLPALLLAAAAPVLFTISASRLPSYASPAFPWIAFLAALGAPAVAAASAEDGAWRRSLARASLGVAGAAAAAAAFVLAWTEPSALPALAPRGALYAVAAGAALASAAAAVACWRAPTAREALPRAALAAAFLVAVLGAGILAGPQRVSALRPLWKATERLRGPGEELGAVMPYTGDWGLLPWYSRSLVRYFDYPSDPMVVRPEAYRPAGFQPESALVPWFIAPERRWLLVRERDREKHLGKTPAVVVASEGDYVILTNHPLPPAGP